MKQFNFTAGLLNSKFQDSLFISLINMHVANSNAGSKECNQIQNILFTS